MAKPDRWVYLITLRPPRGGTTLSEVMEIMNKSIIEVINKTIIDLYIVASHPRLRKYDGVRAV